VVPLVCADAAARLPIDAAIASGSLLSVEALRLVGGMCEDLFIDLVDIEWCLRARSLGYQSFGVCGALLRHTLGESPRSVGGRKVVHHSPLRSYYFFRNAVWLMRQHHAPFAWKLAAVRQLGLRCLFYTVAVAPRLEYLRMMTLGLWHGIRGRLGRLA
jgi:rhamnosyltransferase